MSDFQKFPRLKSSIFLQCEGISELDQHISGWAEGLADEERREILEILLPSEDGDVANEDKNY
jgi:hypothetical protein